jgi:hypothetical protein
MNQRKYRMISLFVLVSTLSACSNLSFVASGKTPFKISVGKKSEKLVEKEATADFYFWGKSPKIFVIDLEDFGHEFGLEEPSNVTISQTLSFKSFLYTIVTLGLYCPVDYKISALSNKAVE